MDESRGEYNKESDQYFNDKGGKPIKKKTLAEINAIWANKRVRDGKRHQSRTIVGDFKSFE